MRILCRHSVSLGVTLCAAIILVTLTGQSAQAKDSATKDSATKESAPPDSEMYDEDFAKHVDIRMLGIAWQTLDPKLMTDVAVQLREAEKVLGRKLPKITSQQILKMASKVAADNKDAETLERLLRVAEANGDAAEASRLKKLQSLAAASRGIDGDLKDVAMFSANDINQGAMAAFSNVLLQIRAAKVSGDGDALTSLAEATDLLSSLRDTHRSRLKGLIDEAVETTGEPDDSVAAIQLLTGASRSIIAPPVAVVSEDELEPSSGKAETAFTAGGMRYVMTPSGAAIKSHGRIGSLLFAPGDLVTGMSGYSLTTGATLDRSINLGYLSGLRSLSVRDGGSGQVSNLSY